MIAIIACTEQDTLDLAARFARTLQETGNNKPGLVIHLQGDLGAGKTTFVRGLLTASGHSGAVRSPTYNIVQPYKINDQSIYHFDLYRINDPEELEELGIRDYFEVGNLCLLEWPEKGKGSLPAPDIIVSLSYVSEGRRIQLTAWSEKGRIILDKMGYTE